MSDRLDKILARELNITRSGAKELLKKGRVSLNGAVIKKGETKCTESDSITVDGKAVGNSEFVYIMMNKPKGVISASDCKGDKTVVDILPEDMKRRGLFPAGRLDKDTTGFVLITDDGEFAHNILSPAHHIDKTYIVTLDKPVTEEVKSDFESGMTLNDEKLLRAELSILNEDRTVAKVVLHQGLYHQIKRMFKKHGLTVTELHREAMGSLILDKDLASGQCRYINSDEKKKILEK